jgi:sugar lactone lactonase YvrE
MRIMAISAILAVQCGGAWHGCNETGPGPKPCKDCCADGFARGSAHPQTRLVASFTPSPEGVTVCPDGDAYVMLDGSGEIWRVPFDGNGPERWASVGGRQAAGLACDEHGRLFAAAFAIRNDPSASVSVVLIEARDSRPRQLPPPSDGTTLNGLNGIVAIPGLGVYASDTLGGLVVRVRETAPDTFETTVLARDVDGANGLAYDSAHRKLYVVGSLVPGVFAFDVATDGTLGTRTAVPIANALTFPDGVAVDETGTVYVAYYFSGSVVRASDGANVAELSNPASLAFRGGTLLITDYKLADPTAAGGLYALGLGVCGAPN